MTLREVPEGPPVFIDANIFIYHFTGLSHECQQFLIGCVHRRFLGVTSTTTLLEVCHRLMAIEAVKRGLVPPQQPARTLQQRPELVRQLSDYYTQITNLLSWDLQILAPDPQMLVKSQLYRQRFGLLTNDSLIPVHLEELQTVHLASADHLFQSLPHVRLYSPADLTPSLTTP